MRGRKGGSGAASDGDGVGMSLFTMGTACEGAVPCVTSGLLGRAPFLIHRALCDSNPFCFSRPCTPPPPAKASPSPTQLESARHRFVTVWQCYITSKVYTTEGRTIQDRQKSSYGRLMRRPSARVN